MTAYMSTLASGLALRFPALLLITGHTGLPFLPHDHPHSEEGGDSNPYEYHPRSLFWHSI